MGICASLNFNRHHEAVEEGHKNSIGDGKYIFVGVTYEKLVDYCFCCGYIGHQYKLCATHKGQTKDEMAYRAWLRAISLPERMGFQRSNKRGNRDQSKTIRK